MKNKVKRRNLSGNEGLTLIEVIVSMTLLSILSLMLITALMMSLAVINATRVRTNTATVAAGQIEADRAKNTTTGGTAALTVPGITLSQGKYVNENDGNITYWDFLPNKKVSP